MSGEEYARQKISEAKTFAAKIGARVRFLDYRDALEKQHSQRPCQHLFHGGGCLPNLVGSGVFIRLRTRRDRISIFGVLSIAADSL